MPSRNLSDLDPRIQDGARAVVRAWADKGYSVVVTCTFRSAAEQDALYAQGRTEPGRIVTHARGGQSLHNMGLAIDFLPLVGGKPMWDAESPMWQELARIAESVDARISWGGGWDAPKTDRPHIEWHLPVA